jgi:hypothetical protein
MATADRKTSPFNPPVAVQRKDGAKPADQRSDASIVFTNGSLIEYAVVPVSEYLLYAVL